MGGEGADLMLHLKLAEDWSILELQREMVTRYTIMPCFDKKLEASREDFTHPDTGVKEVDCVLTTLEERWGVPGCQIS